jgi:hypothetical protein
VLVSSSAIFWTYASIAEVQTINSCGTEIADFHKWISTLPQLSVTGVEPEPESDPDLHGSSAHPNRLQKNGQKNVAALRLRIFKIGLPQFRNSQ